MCETRFYVCEHCGNIVGMIHNAGAPMICCGMKMVELIPNSVNASVEMHLPVVTVENGKVHAKIGAIPHPMIERHHIVWVYLQTDRGGQRKCLEVGGKPEASFALCDEKPVAVYAYCNIHGLWKTEL